MKKLMIALAVAAVAVMGQASQVKWSSGALTDPDGASAAGLRYWCFISSDTSGSTAANKLLTIAQAEEYLAAGDFATLKTYNSKVGTVATGTDAIGTTYTTQNAAWTTGTTIDSFVVLFDVADKDATGAEHYMILEPEATISFANADQQSTFTVTAGDWTAITAAPEPTSGLLLLLGVAGLALRRRRA